MKHGIARMVLDLLEQWPVTDAVAASELRQELRLAVNGDACVAHSWLQAFRDRDSRGLVPDEESRAGDAHLACACGESQLEHSGEMDVKFRETLARYGLHVRHVV